MFVQGPRVALRPLTRADLDYMANWRPYEDPLFAEANWLRRSSRELDRWYARNSQDPGRLLCAVVGESGQVIGSITLRGRDGRRSARLGVTLGADFVDQGYGTEALTLFLDYYFGELGFEKLVLDVSGFNRRAIRVYRKLGFVTVNRYERSVGRSKEWAFLNEPAYANVRRFFRGDWLGRQWLLCYDMELKREDWEQRRKTR
jgi:diamine N-acetyltransferase